MSSKKKRSITSLIDAIYKSGNFTPEGQLAIHELSQHGAAGIDAVIAVTKSPRPSSLDGKDLHETITAVHCAFAEHYSTELVDRIDAIGRFRVYWALGYATDSRSINVLIEGLKAKDMWERWAVVESLIRRASTRSVSPLMQRLKDRSPLVKGRVLAAMKEHQWLRQSDALPLLSPLRESPSVQKQTPGIWKVAGEVIELIERESGR